VLGVQHAETTPENLLSEQITKDDLAEASMAEASIVEEIVEKRTQYSKEFLLSNGLCLAVVYPEAVHYEKNNTWEEIDNTLKAVGSGSNGVLTNTAGAWQVTFPQQLTGNNMVSVTRAGYTLSFGMAGEIRTLSVVSDATVSRLGAIAKEAIENSKIDIVDANVSAAQIQQVDLTEIRNNMEHPEAFVDTLFSRLCYENVYANTDVAYDLSSGQVKESIVLEKYDSALTGYRYTLDTGDMLPVLQEDGSITLFAPDGETVVMTMPAPYLVDSSGARNEDVEVTLSRSGNGYIMAYSLPTQWLASEYRAWPVVLDPIVVADGYCKNVEDQTITELQNLPYTEGVVQCGYRTGFGLMRFFIKYSDLPHLNSADVVVYAHMQLHKPQNSGVDASVEVHKVQGAWSSQTITWGEAPAFNPIVEDYAMVKLAGDYSWDVTSIVQEWYSTGVNNGMMFKASDEIEAARDENWKQFYSSDYTTLTPAVWPTLEIAYRNTSGLESYWDYTTNSAGRAGAGYVNDYTGNLVWVRGDIGFGGNRMPVSISHIYNADDSKHNRYGMGCGWKTNFNQTVSSVGNSMNAPYVWEDGDGTDHYFVFDDTTETYKDEDGLGLTLTVTNTGITITDKYDNSSYFDAKGRLIKQENYQQTRSSINITYTDTNSLRIAQITDGAGRPYYFIYNSDNQLEMITYYGKLTTDVSRVSFTYSGNQLHSIIDKDGGVSTFSYIEGNLLSEVQDVDGYRLVYTYTTSSPKRVTSISEYQGPVTDGKLGGSIAITYSHNQTTFVDHNNNVQIIQFNDWGNTISVQDGEGRAQFAQYSMNKYGETGDKQNQLKLSSKLQNTVGNLLYENSFENANLWGSNSTELSIIATNEESYLGGSALKAVVTTENTYYGAFSPSFDLAPGETVTFSAYVKNPDAPAYIALHHNDGVDFYTFEGETLPASDEWVRTEVTYTNTFDYTVNACAYLFTPQPGTYYIDCVQVEKAASSSRFNLVDNGDFRYGLYGWENGNGTVVNVVGSAAPELDANAYQIIGNQGWEGVLSQTIKQSGSANDCYVFAGWAKGNAIPLTSDDRAFGLKVIFGDDDDSPDDTDPEVYVSFNPDLPTNGNWQYVSAPAVADEEYTKIIIQILYVHGANTVWFDGIQLYKETFGSSYTYDDNGNATSVIDLQKQATTYEYDTNNNLTKILQDNKAKVTYTYDDYHNVKTATTEEGLVYTFEYDQWGNNTSVTIQDSTGAKIRSSAKYTDDGNALTSTTNTLYKTTRYGYNVDTNVLEWVQYPEDTEATRTVYTYDDMYRLASAVTNVDSDYSLYASYGYTNDLLTRLTTNSTVYNFTYGDFAQRSSVGVGNRTLASYTYTDDQNRYLDKLTYGNGDYVKYEYDSLGRVTKETFENGSTVSYAYDNSGALATVTDSATGIKTSYYYDLTDRMMKYVETDGTNTHSVGYEYDLLNNLTMLVETINGRKVTSSHTYDDDNRLTQTVVSDSSLDNDTQIMYYYDAFGRIYEISTGYGDDWVIDKNYFFASAASGTTSSQVTNYQIGISNSVIDFNYTYNDNGNITGVEYGTYKYTYVYDTANQLIRENNKFANKTWVWEYDDAGNILSKKEYAYTTGSLGAVLDTVTYTYGNRVWGDLLTAYDGVAISYDTIGNPLYDGTWHYNWRNGRELAAMSNGTTTWSYTYDANGMRTKRTNGSTTYTYVYNGGQLSQMTIGNNTLSFVYDATGAPVMVFWRGMPYYYVTNLQGDVLLILDADGDIVVSYDYDAWGKLLYVGGSKASTLGVMNPLTYRGYVYDRETGLYYLQSRYYNPKIGRFLNADALVSTGQGLTGNNMFAYCLNNPTNGIDPGGKWTMGFSIGANLTVILGVSISVGVYWDDEGNVDWQWSYSVPGVDDTVGVGVLDVGVSAAVQYTNADTVYDLYGPSYYVGASGGPLWYVGADLIGFEDGNPNNGVDGVQLVGGFGWGLDIHATKTYTRPLDQRDNSTSNGDSLSHPKSIGVVVNTIRAACVCW